MIIEKRVSDLKRKTKLLRDIREIMNEIKSNCAYSEKEFETDIKKLENMKVPRKEIELLADLWSMRMTLGRSLMQEAGELVKYGKRIQKEKKDKDM